VEQRSLVKMKVLIMLGVLLVSFMFTGLASADEKEGGSIGLTASPSAFTIEDSVEPGSDSEEKSVKVVVKNVGNEKEYFTITPKGYLLVKPDQFELEPNETKTVEVFLKVPETATPEQRNDTFRILAKGEITKSHNAELEVKVNYTVGGEEQTASWFEENLVYLVVGLVIVVLSIVFFLFYRKKKKDEKKQEGKPTVTDELENKEQ